MSHSRWRSARAAAVGSVLMISTVLVGGANAHTQAQVSAPTFTLVDSWGYSVNGDGWTDGMATVELIAPDSTSYPSPVPVVGNQFWENLDAPEDFGPGWSVVVTGVDEGETSSLALPLLNVDRVDTSVDKVGGTADPGLQFTARSCTDGSETCTEVEVDGAAGQWISPVLPVNDRRIDARYFDPVGGGALEVQYLWPSLVYQRYQQYPDLGHQLSAWNFPPNKHISITVDGPGYAFDQAVVGQTDGGGNWTLDLASQQMEIPIEDPTIVGSGWTLAGATVVDDWVMNKVLTGIDLTIETVDQIDNANPNTGSASGRCTDDYEIQVGILHGLYFTNDSEHVVPTCTQLGTWTASWALDETGIPEISAFRSEVDNDGFGVQHARPSLSLGDDGVNPLQLGFHAWHMTEESTLTITDESDTTLWSGVINDLVVDRPGEPGRYDLSLSPLVNTTLINDGWTFRVESDTQLKSVVAETVTIDTTADGSASLNEFGEVTGTAPPNRYLVVHVGDQEFETWSDNVGIWTAGGGLAEAGEVAAWMTDRDGDFNSIEVVFEPTPSRQIDANPALDTVSAWQSESGLWLTIARGDPLAEVYPLDQYSGFTDQQMFNLREEGFDLRPSDVVTVSDGTSTKQHEVVALSFDELNAVDDVAAGTAPNGSVVRVGVGNQTGGFEFEVVAEPVEPSAPSTWFADFGAQDFDITEDMGGRARVFDDDGDATTIFTGGGGQASLQVGIGPFATGIAGFGFQPGEPIMVMVDDPDTVEAPDYSWRIPDDFPDGGADVFDGNFGLQAPFSDGENPVVLETGDIVTATDGVLTLSHTVRYVEFTGVDAQSDTVTGLATPGEMLDVSWGNPEQWRSEQQHVTLDACESTDTDCDPGTWTVDLTDMGGFLDGDSGGITVPDEHGSQTILMWGAPFIGASIDQDYGLYDAIWGAFWYFDNQVTVTVWNSAEDITDNPDDAKFHHTYDVEKHHWNEFGSDNLYANPTDIVAGNIVVAEGLQTGTVTTHQVLDLVVEGWENAASDADPPGGNRVFGTAQPVGPFDFARVGVYAEPAGDGMRFADIDTGTGAWEVNFYDNPVEGEYGDGIEIQFGVNGSVELRGPNGNLTSARWGTHEGGDPQGPAIEVDPVDDVIYLYGYDDPSVFELTLNGESLVPQSPPEEGGDPGDGEDPAEDDGRSVFIFDVYPTDVHTGDIVVLSLAGQEVRRHTVTDVTVTDLVGSEVFGTASPFGVVAIDAHSGEEEMGAQRFVVADVDGTWSADFGVAPEDGAGDNIINDVTGVRTSINVRELDGDGDSTVISIGENVVGMFVVPELDLVMASDWSGLAPLSIEVEGETFHFDLERGPDMVSFGGFDFPDPMSWYVLAELPIDLVPGQVITATDGLISISHVIRDIRVDEADTISNTISGYGEPLQVDEPMQVIAFLIDDIGGAGVGFTELAAAGPWTVPLLDASSETEQQYNLQHFHGTGIALVPEEDDGFGPDNATAVLWDMAPHITELDLPADPARIESGIADVALHAAFTDIEFPDTHTAIIDWGDGNLTTMTPASGQGPGSGGTIDTVHAYTTPGVYRVVLTVTDAEDSVAQAEFQYVVVYDPSAGSAIGNGKWETDDGALVSEAKFGYNIKYKQDSTTPDGNFKFTYKSESNDTETKWKFEADTLDYLAIYNEWAQFAGTGSLDHGGGTFDFKVTMVDGDQPGGGDDDLIRIQIWDETGMLYDNQAGDSDDAYPTAGIDKGAIKIAPKGGTSPR